MRCAPSARSAGADDRAIPLCTTTIRSAGYPWAIRLSATYRLTAVMRRKAATASQRCSRLRHPPMAARVVISCTLRIAGVLVSSATGATALMVNATNECRTVTSSSRTTAL